jgi:hypothetical protein
MGRGCRRADLGDAEAAGIWATTSCTWGRKGLSTSRSRQRTERLVEGGERHGRAQRRNVGIGRNFGTSASAPESGRLPARP